MYTFKDVALTMASKLDVSYSDALDLAEEFVQEAEYTYGYEIDPYNIEENQLKDIVLLAHEALSISGILV